MTGTERRKRMIRLAAVKGSLSARELAEYFGVSRMTIHRDLQILDASGALKCIHGGAVPAFRPRPATEQGFCKTCDAPIVPHQRYLLQFPDQARDVFCCACCGLKTHLKQAPMGIFHATDMISGTMFPAEEAYFLIRSSASPCCHPSILTFADEAQAGTFRSSFGGVLGRLCEALDFLRTEQTLENSR
ncbi:MAG TPA: DeoR family transcriptional regulator [Geopsychrobacteraceae bacterium]|jgi:hypothetical protein